MLASRPQGSGVLGSERTGRRDRDCNQAFSDRVSARDRRGDGFWLRRLRERRCGHGGDCLRGIEADPRRHRGFRERPIVSGDERTQRTGGGSVGGRRRLRDAWGTGAKGGSPVLSPAPLYRVRVGQHPGYDWVVFDLNGPAPVGYPA